ncbi:hypothetical protein HNP84_008869 [Thermocatellispora tengchongensis]|uniref:Methyltransferase n=1 Tax=Thermocatellispora tengchongensis TaxID=1073253 RepID=A0A840PJM9_9ACTN|nr:SCO2525 family SAM-dependent methyltransferase [Thermocatellispora tengchongensis]MBB5139106.1 hypothetical protein [Thermocatellispora tengchongensis]
MKVHHSGNVHLKDTANSEYPWDEFDPYLYFQHNYGILRPDDREIIERVGKFFSGITDIYGAEGVDVGTGPNLYPALALLPLCRTITMVEYSRSNVEWLEREVKRYSPSWEPFWEVLAEHRKYQEVGDPRAALARRAQVWKGSLFRLPPTRKWHVGTMFFVAESITGTQAEFVRALRAFMNALRPTAPFAIAFMENSTGYKVGEHFFPAVKVDAGIVESKLEPYTDTLHVHHIDSDGLLRDGYSGMILAYGRLRK